MHVFVGLFRLGIEIGRLGEQDIDIFGKLDGIFARACVHDEGKALAFARDADIFEAYGASVVGRDDAVALEDADFGAGDAVFCEFFHAD